MVAVESAFFSRARVRPGLALALGFLAGLAPGCGGGGSGEEKPAAGSSSSDAPATPGAPSSSGGRNASAPPVTPTDETALESTELGGLHGTILFRGEVPERFALGATSNAECSHHPEVDQRSNVVIVNDGKLANAFVTLSSGVDKAKLPPVSSTPATLEQRGCMYVPRVVGVRVGQTLSVTNEDPTTHNVHSRAKRNQELNRNMGASQPALEFRFERAERPVPFVCDIHPWMGAAVFVEEHPWFAVTDAAGAFRIDDVPPGTYEVTAWHETLGKVTGTVSVTAGKSTGFTLTLAR